MKKMLPAEGERDAWKEFDWHLIGRSDWQVCTIWVALTFATAAVLSEAASAQAAGALRRRTQAGGGKPAHLRSSVTASNTRNTWTNRKTVESLCYQISCALERVM